MSKCYQESEADKAKSLGEPLEVRPPKRLWVASLKGHLGLYRSLIDGKEGYTEYIRADQAEAKHE